MSDFDLQFQLVHLGDAGNLYVDVGLEIPIVFFVENKVLHFSSKELYILEGSIETDVDE